MSKKVGDNSKAVERIRDLTGLGPKSEQMLAQIGVNSAEDFLAADPFLLYAQFKLHSMSVSVNLLYAMIGAQEGHHWQEIAQSRREEILIRLDDMGLAPK